MNCMLVDVVDVKVLDGYRLHLQFDDGAEGSVDISTLIDFKGVFEPLSGHAFFSKVSVDPNIGTIFWENGADLFPAYLRENIQS